MSARCRMSRASDAISHSRACRSAASSAITNTSVKNRSTTGPRPASLREGLAGSRSPVGERLLDDRPPLRRARRAATVSAGSVKRPPARRPRDPRRRTPRRQLARDVLHAFEQRRPAAWNSAVSVNSRQRLAASAAHRSGSRSSSGRPESTARTLPYIEAALLEHVRRAVRRGTSRAPRARRLSSATP